MGQPASGAEIRSTTCNRDCPDACSLLVTVEDGRATKLAGDPADPVTRGFLCPRTLRFLSRQYDPERFTTPMLRRDGRLRPIGWEQALDLAAQKLLAIREESGPAAILHYRSGGSLGILKVLADHLFEQFGPVTIKRGDICSGAGEAAQIRDFGVSESHDLFDLLHSRTILVWGKNVHTGSVHLVPVLQEARRRGATLVGIDPVRTKVAGLCARFLQPRPGGDFALALGLARRLFEQGWTDPGAAQWCEGYEAFRALAFSRDVAGWAQQADVPVDDLLALAEQYGTVKPGALLVGWGLARRKNGSASVRALDALGAISGNLGVPGGGVSYYFGRRASFDLGFVKGEAVAPRTLSEACLGRQILEARDPPIRGAWITAGNPVSMLPDSSVVRRALQQTEFVVVVDTHPTDTTDCAHLVLPTLTLLEDSDVLGAFGNHWIRESRGALDPPGADDGGPRHELAILQGLAARLGRGEVLAGSVDEWKRKVMRRLDGVGAGLDALRQHGPRRSPLAPEVLFAEHRFPTPSGRAQLVTQPAAPPPAPSAEWPLLLLAVSTPDAQSSQWSLPVSACEVRVHPRAASGLPDGAAARLVSRRGALAVRVRHDEGVRPDVALMAKGGMLRTGGCPNALVLAVETDDGGGAAYYDEGVRLEPA